MQTVAPNFVRDRETKTFQCGTVLMRIIQPFFPSTPSNN
jgi:hypothetical protein